ncbi:MAG: hypothetical protein PF590_06905 [Candidatus Delongbacteria bacterium]|jgi:hypothetical protein|nr:hypothetical protein [Candidatus Delongbacteria bacterium]
MDTIDIPRFRSLTEAVILTCGMVCCLPAQQIDRRLCSAELCGDGKILFGQMSTAAMPQARYRPEAETMQDEYDNFPAALNTNN